MVDTAPVHSTDTPKADAAATPPRAPRRRDGHRRPHRRGPARQHLLGRWADDRRTSRRLALDPAMHKIEGMPYADARARTLDQLRVLVDAGAIQRPYPEEFGGQSNHGGNLAAFEELTTATPSMQIKAGVQWACSGPPSTTSAPNATTASSCPASSRSRSPAASR